MASDQFSPAVLAAWKAIRESYPVYLGCLRGRCGGAEPGRHCQTCRDYLDASVDLRGLLDLRTWDASPEEGGDPRAERLAAQLDAALEA
jgi:hypothetical protein